MSTAPITNNIQNGYLKQPPDYYLTTTNINFINPEGFDELSGPLHPINQVCMPVDICCYSNSKALTEDFNFKDNGFQFCKLQEEDPLVQTIDKCAQIIREGSEMINSQLECELKDQLQTFLVTWGKENGIPGVPIIATDVVYRSSSPTPDPYTNRPLCLAHIDFDKERLKDPSTPEGKHYQSGVRLRLAECGRTQELSDEEYSKFVTGKVTYVNIWTSLNIEPSNSTLVVMNKASVQGAKSHPISFGAGMISYGPAPHTEQQWITPDDLTITKRLLLLFETTDTVHTGIFRTDVPVRPRHSMEIRTVFGNEL